MPSEKEAIAKRTAWREKRAAMGDNYYTTQLPGRWKCWATIVTKPCTNFGVLVHEGKAYCDICGEPAPDAARILGVE